MEQEHHITFGPFSLETTYGRLWQGKYSVALRPRSMAVLRYLVTHPGCLVTKAELRQHVWAGTHVTDTVLRVCIREIRAALQDSATVPQYLETIGQQGYRFLVQGDGSMPSPMVGPLVVGRQPEVAILEAWFQRATTGARQLGFISGEAGIGKTTVVDVWLASHAGEHTVRVGLGRCVESYGQGEPYLPLLEALDVLVRGRAGNEVLTVLRQYAPMWLVQLPGLLGDADLERVQRQVQGATPARMLRELAQAVQVLTADMPLVLILEDLHWSDNATVECLAYLAQRREPARLLVVGTYRPVETVLRVHPLRGLVQEIRGRGQGVELRLELLPAEDVVAYVTGRLGGPVTAPLAAHIHEYTEGNALFMVNFLEHLVQQGLVIWQTGQWTLRPGAETNRTGVPEGLRQLLMRRIETLPVQTQRVLEAASVVGKAFAAAAVAAGAQCSVAEVEAVCEALAAQQHFIEDIGLTSWPDGTSSGDYRFHHALYQQVLYERLGSTRRMHVHRHIGARLEAGYGVRAPEIAAQLAVHWERGGEEVQAVYYLQYVGDNAARRNAYHDAMAACTRGLALLARMPDSPERTRHELTLQLMLGEQFIATNGMASPEAGSIYHRVQALCQQVDEESQRFRALWGLVLFHFSQAQLHTAGELCQELSRLGQQQHDAVLLLLGHLVGGRHVFLQGDFVTARAQLEQCLPLCATPQPPTPPFLRQYEAGVKHGTWLAQVLWGLGYAEQAQQRSQEALTLAQQSAHTSMLSYVTFFATVLAQCRRDAVATYAHAEVLLTFTTAQGLMRRYEQGRILRGWALAMQGDAATGIAQIQQGLTATQEVGSKLLLPYFLTLLAEAYGQAGQPEAGLTVLAEAATLVATTEERWWEAEIYRLQGALHLQLPYPDIPQAEAALHRALAVARAQQVRVLELRAAVSLSRLWQAHGKHAAAYTVLSDVYGWFTEGFDTADLREAKALLEAWMEENAAPLTAGASMTG